MTVCCLTFLNQTSFYPAVSESAETGPSYAIREPHNVNGENAIYARYDKNNKFIIHE